MKKTMKKKKKSPAKKSAPKAKKAKLKAKPKAKAKVKAKSKSKVAAKTKPKSGKKSQTVSFAELFELKKKMEADKLGTNPEATTPPHELHREESQAAKVQPDVRNNRTNGSGSRHH